MGEFAYGIWGVLKRIRGYMNMMRHGIAALLSVKRIGDYVPDVKNVQVGILVYTSVHRAKKIRKQKVACKILKVQRGGPEIAVYYGDIGRCASSPVLAQRSSSSCVGCDTAVLSLWIVVSLSPLECDGRRSTADCSAEP